MADPLPPSRRRDKPILSCTFCRGRKLRCDRQSPCSACVRHGTPLRCVYSSSDEARKHAVDYRPHARSQQARQRIARLENLVTEMRDMTRRPIRPRDPPAAAVTSSEDSGTPVSDSLGRLSLTDDHAVYIGSSHWAAILEDIQYLKSDMSEEGAGTPSDRGMGSLDTDPTSSPPVTRISLLTSAIRLPAEHILAMVPARKVVDRHIAQFFNAYDWARFILHRETFLAEYASFWVDPSAAPIMWVGLLFGVMSMSALLQQRDTEALGLSSTEPRDMLDTFRTLTVHCLITGDYLRPGRYTIETLTLHFAVDQSVNVDADVGNWVLIGVVIRIALRMGLHRDPSHWPTIRPLHAELRRRMWMALYQMDFFTSTEVGLPRIIKDSQCDTRPPSHLLDDDLGVHHDQVPPERPHTEPTPLSYIIQRNIIVKIAAQIYDVTEASPPSPTDIAALTAKLDAAVDALPPWLRYTSLETLIAEDPVVILQRMFLDILIHKAVYLLHRRSFVRGSSGAGDPESNRRCITAALAILEHQRGMHDETQPGGLMFSIRWKVANAVNHEFLQATMMLCLVLARFNEGHAGSMTGSPLQQRDEIMRALTFAQALWEKQSDRSTEARRAAKAIALVLSSGSKAPTPVTQDMLYGMFESMTGVSAHPGVESGLGFEHGALMGDVFFAGDEFGGVLGNTLNEFLDLPLDDSGASQ